MNCIVSPSSCDNSTISGSTNGAVCTCLAIVCTKCTRSASCSARPTSSLTAASPLTIPVR